MNLTVSIMNSEQVLYAGEVTAISSYNDLGLFDILPLHTNFITLIKDAVIIKELTGAKKEIKIAKGVLRAKANQVEVFLETWQK